MPFRPGLALGQKLLLQFEHQVGVLAVGGGDHPEFLCEAQGLVKLFVGHAKRAFIRKENFKTAQPPLDDFHELLFRCIVIPGHSHMEGEVASAFAFRFFYCLWGDVYSFWYADRKI